MSKIFKVIILSLLIATSSLAGSDGQNELSKNTNGEVKDCFETVNRGIFAFNQAIDGLIFEPLASGYKHLPSPIRTGTSNFVGNVSTLLTIPNNVLQGNFSTAGKNTLRFIVNTTFGIVGLFDPATAIGLNSYEKEDFGQTLGSWGFGEGCYVVLPVLGPSTARDALGSLGNYMGGDAWYNVTVRNDTHYFSDFDYYASKGVGGVDFRAKNFDDINNLEENSIDFYASVKSLYLQDRRKRILNASGATQTQNDSDWEEIE
tara:strand:+ start:45 stop:824 length:780 start_codon:yes stop_codon:yes gene_type:complete